MPCSRSCCASQPKSRRAADGSATQALCASSRTLSRLVDGRSRVKLAENSISGAARRSKPSGTGTVMPRGRPMAAATVLTTCVWVKHLGVVEEVGPAPRGLALRGCDEPLDQVLHVHHHGAGLRQPQPGMDALSDDPEGLADIALPLAVHGCRAHDRHGQPLAILIGDPLGLALRQAVPRDRLREIGLHQRPIRRAGPAAARLETYRKRRSRAALTCSTHASRLRVP